MVGSGKPSPDDVKTSPGIPGNEPVFEIIDEGEDCAALPPGSIAVENFEEMVSTSNGKQGPAKDYDKTIRQLVEEAVKEESVSWHQLSTTRIRTVGEEILRNPLATRFGTVNHGNAQTWLYSWRSYRVCVTASLSAG